MDDPVDKQTLFISKLVELSQKGLIDWQPHERGGYEGKVGGRSIRVFMAERSLNVGLLRAVPIKSQVPVLEVLDEVGRVAYTFEDVAGLRDLMESASFRASRIDEFMDSVLAGSASDTYRKVSA